MTDPINMIESRQNTSFRTVFRIFMHYVNSLFFVNQNVGKVIKSTLPPRRSISILYFST